jgi:hypothetical protein
MPLPMELMLNLSWWAAIYPNCDDANSVTASM